MRWQIAHFIFCDQQQSLTSEDGVQQLEPMMVELLRYFCQHPDSIIAVDELVNEVWLGRIVSDNAVSRVVTKLRKAFSDDPRQPRFIATFPKKGYKFIAPVIALPQGVNQLKNAVQLTPEPSSTDAGNPAVKVTDDNVAGAKPNRFKTYWIAVFCLGLLLIVFAQNLLFPQPEPLSQSTHARALIRDADEEWFPSFAPDGERIAYMSSGQQGLSLIVRSLTSGETIEVDHGGDVGVGPGDWNSRGDAIVYLVASKQRCEYYIRPVSGMQLGEARLVHSCPAGSYGKVMFSHDDNSVIFSENSGHGTPYSIYQLNLSTGVKRRVNQPDIYLAGNNQFDLHPSRNALLISSPDKQQWEGFYQLDLDTDQLKLLFKLDAYICCGIWSQSGDRVILMGEHPAYQLVSYDLSGKDKQVIYSGSRWIQRPSRHINGRDYVFVARERNTNIQMLDTETQQKNAIADDSADELLATFANNSNRVAYVSMVSGSEEVWTLDLNTMKRRKLTHFNDGRHYLDLKWSTGDRYLAALTFNEIHLLNVETGEFEKLELPQKEMRGVSFKSDSEITFSVKEGERWRVYRFDIDGKVVAAEDPQWAFIQYRSNSEDTLWLTADNKLYAGEQQTPVINKTIPAEQLLWDRQWNLRKQADHWFWYEQTEQGRIQRYSNSTGDTTSVVRGTYGHFDVKGSKLLYGDMLKVNGDLYQTVSAD